MRASSVRVSAVHTRASAVCTKSLSAMGVCARVSMAQYSCSHRRIVPWVVRSSWMDDDEEREEGEGVVQTPEYAPRGATGS